MLPASAAPPPSAFRVTTHQPQQYRIRGWFDLLVDVLVGPGDAPQVDNKKKPKHALVCAKCYSHNGLVPDGGVRECSRFIVFFGRGEVFFEGGAVLGARPLRVSRGRGCACMCVSPSAWVELERRGGGSMGCSCATATATASALMWGAARR